MDQKQAKIFRKSKHDHKMAYEPHGINIILPFSYDGSHFAMSLEASVENKMKRGKLPRRNRYLHYYYWAHALLVCIVLVYEA